MHGLVWSTARPGVKEWSLSLHVSQSHLGRRLKDAVLDGSLTRVPLTLLWLRAFSSDTVGTQLNKVNNSIVHSRATEGNRLASHKLREALCRVRETSLLQSSLQHDPPFFFLLFQTFPWGRLYLFSMLSLKRLFHYIC